MLPGPVALREAIRPGINRYILPAKQPPIQTHRADFDADSARGYALLVQLIAMLGTALLIGQTLGVIPLIQCIDRTHLNAAHAFRAELLISNWVRWKNCGGEDRAEAHPGTIIWRQEHIVHTEASQACQKGSMAVGEDCHRIFQQRPDSDVSIPGNEDGRMAQLGEIAGQAVGILVEKGVDCAVQLPVIDRGRRFQNWQADW